MKTLHIIILSGLLTASVQPKAKANFDNNDDIFAAIGIGAAAVATAIGGGFFLNWLLTPTDEQLIAKTQSELLDYKNNLHQLVVDLSSNSYANQTSVAYSLQRIVDAAGGADISHISSRIDNAVYTFNQAQNDLAKRIAKLSKDSHVSTVRFKINQMDVLKTELHMTQPALLYAQRFIKDHKAYFNLGAVLNKTYKNFPHEYAMAFNDYPLSMDSLRPSPLFSRNYKYPFHAYINDMKSIHSEVQKAGSHIKSEWTPAYGSTYAIYQRLNVYFAAIVSVVQTSDLFIQEKHFKSQQELLERQLELERQIKQIEQAKLDAIREQNSILKEQNEIKERELRLQHERLLQQLRDANYNNPNITIQFRN